MGQTPNSSSTAYLTVDQFLNRNDLNTVAMLSVDDGTKPTQSQLQANPNLLAVLLAASGELESACLASERYSVADLQAANGASQAFMQQIVSDLAMFALYRRRNAPNIPETCQHGYEKALASLDQLRTGERILAFQEVENAGIASDEFMTATDIANQNLFTFGARRVFGVRQDLRRPTY